MKIPKKATRLLKFKHGDQWYRITQEGEKYCLYRCDTDIDHTLLGTGNLPTKLENKVYEGKYK